MQSRASTIYGFMGAFVPLAFMAVCLRLYTRFKFAKIGADDILISIGFVRPSFAFSFANPHDERKK